MKDLFKGLHPWLLVLVFTVALLLAGILRHTFISFGHTDFNANLTFIIVLLAIVSSYALFFEYRRGGSFPKLIVAKPITVADATASPIVSEEIIANPTTVPNSNIEINERNTWSLDDFSRIKEEITSEVLMAINSQNTEIKNDTAGMSTFQINLSKVHRETALAREEEQKQLFDKACKYTLEVLGPYVTPEGIEVIFGRIMRFMQAIGATWEVRSAKELKENLEAIKITPVEPLAKIDLLHYGWNIGGWRRQPASTASDTSQARTKSPPPTTPTKCPVAASPASASSDSIQLHPLTPARLTLLSGCFFFSLSISFASLRIAM